LLIASAKPAVWSLVAIEISLKSGAAPSEEVAQSIKPHMHVTDSRWN
jgi:hypothetical protein